MSWSPNRRSVLQAGAATLLAGSAIGRALAADIPTKPEAGAIKMGIEPWLRYGIWENAGQEGDLQGAWAGGSRDRQFHGRRRYQRSAGGGPAAMRQHRHPYRYGVRRG